MKKLTSDKTSGDLLSEKQRLAHEEALRLLKKDSSKPQAAPSGGEAATSSNQ